jgi:DNA-binding LacI/PurR family transcriptional regulator
VFVLTKVNIKDPTPKYLQTQRILIDAIRAGSLPPGCKLPSTKEISSLVDVSLITAHKALERMVESGWLRREVGRGTYVRDDVDIRRDGRPHVSIGIVLDRNVNLNDYYHSTIIEGLRREARADEYQVEFYFHDEFEMRGARKNGDTGAICIHPALEAQADVERFARHYPVVVLGGAFPNTEVATVDCDNFRGARQAVRHLIELGHQQFLVLSGPTNLSNARDRAAGAAMELAVHGIPLGDRDSFVSKDSVILDEDTKTRMERRLSDPDRPTAIVAGGFYLAMAAMQVVRRAGLSMPEEVSVVGFDDPASAPLLDPPLTTVRQPLQEMAAEAYRMVRDAIVTGSRPPRVVRLSAEMVVRGSTAPPA